MAKKDEASNAEAIVSNENGFKEYSSPIYLKHRIGNDIQFENGYYATANKSKQKAIEGDPLFGVKIFEKK